MTKKTGAMKQGFTINYLIERQHKKVHVGHECWRKMDVAPSTNEKQLICMLSHVLAKLDRKFSRSHLDSFPPQ